MSTPLVSNSPHEPLASGLAGRSHWTRRLGAITSAYRARRAAAAMHMLGERSLHDLGLDRGGIEHAVRFGRG